ncbi:MAG: LacI family DNA-binding transcriptional regulator, partial [Thermogemmatispora sp.]|nr:LacI family DNA-binding transcriptional regulator [Thermogemmatispora sp.]
MGFFGYNFRNRLRYRSRERLQPISGRPSEEWREGLRVSVRRIAMAEKLTIRDIARLAGVSKATVSR